MAVATLWEAILVATLLLACLDAACSYHIADRNPEEMLDNSLKKQNNRDSRNNVWNKMMLSQRRFLQDKAQHEDKVESGANWKLKRKKLTLRTKGKNKASNNSKKWTPNDLGWSRDDLRKMLKIPRNRRYGMLQLRWSIQGAEREFSSFSSLSFGAGLTEFYGAGGSTGISRAKGGAMTLFNTMYPGFGQSGEWTLQPKDDELFEHPKPSGPIDINVLKSQLWASSILRDNMVTVFGYVINFPNNPLRTELYTSLVLLYDIIRFRRIRTVELVPVLQMMASACPSNQFLYLFQKMKTVVPKYMHSSVSVWIDALKRKDVDIDAIVRPNGGPVVVDFLAGIDSSVLDSLGEQINFQVKTIQNASPSLAESMGRLLANVFSALSDGSLILTQDLFALIMLHRPLNMMLPQREETERYLIDIFRLKSVEHWESITKSVKPEDFNDPIKLIRLILTRISMHKEFDPLIQEDARYVLKYVEEPLVTFVNAAYNLASPVMSKPTIDLLQLLKSIMPVEYPDEVLDLKTRIEYYILNGYLDIEFVIKGFNRFDHLRPVDLLIAILTRIHRRLPKLPHEIISSVKYLKLYLIFKRFLCSMSSTVPTDLVDVTSFVYAFDGPRMPKRILNLVKKLAENLPYEKVNWTDLANETPIEECSRPRQCIHSIFKRVIKKGILMGRPSLNDMEEFMKLLDDQGNPLPEESSTEGQLTEKIQGRNGQNIYQQHIYESTHFTPLSKSVTELCNHHGFARVGTCVRPCESSEITTPQNVQSETGNIWIPSIPLSTQESTLKESTTETSSFSCSTNSAGYDYSTTESISVLTPSYSVTSTSDEVIPTLSTSTQLASTFDMLTTDTDTEEAQTMSTTSDEIIIETNTLITTEYSQNTGDITVTEVDLQPLNVTETNSKIIKLQNEGRVTECSTSQTSETAHMINTTPSTEMSSDSSVTNSDVSEDHAITSNGCSSTPKLLIETDVLTSTESSPLLMSSDYSSFGTKFDEFSIPDSVASSDQEDSSMSVSETTEYSDAASFTESPTPYSEALSVEPGPSTGESNTFPSLPESPSYYTEKTGSTVNVASETMNGVFSKPVGMWESSTECPGTTIFEEATYATVSASSDKSVTEPSTTTSRTEESSASSILSSTLSSTVESEKMVSPFILTTPSNITGYASAVYFSNFSRPNSSFSFSSFWNASISLSNNKNGSDISLIEPTIEPEPTNLEYIPQLSSDRTRKITNTEHTRPVEASTSVAVKDQISTLTDSSSPKYESVECSTESGMSATGTHPPQMSDEGIKSSSETYLTTEIPFSSFDSLTPQIWYLPLSPLSSKNISDKSASSSPYLPDTRNQSVQGEETSRDVTTEFTDKESYFSESPIGTSSTEETSEGVSALGGIREASLGMQTSSSSECTKGLTSDAWVSDVTETSTEISNELTTYQETEGVEIVNGAISDSWYPMISHPTDDTGGTVTLELPSFSQSAELTTDAELTENPILYPGHIGLGMTEDRLVSKEIYPTIVGGMERQTGVSEMSLDTSTQTFPVPDRPDEFYTDEWTPTTPNILSPIVTSSTHSMEMQAILEAQHYRPELGCNKLQHNCVEDISSIVYEGPKMKEINMTAIYPPDFLPPNYMFVQGRFVFIGQYAQYGLFQPGGVENSFTTLQMWKQYQQNNYYSYLNNYYTYPGLPTQININNINIQNVQQNIINTDVRLPIMNPLVQHEPACSSYPETLIPLTEPGSLQDVKLRPLRIFLSNPYLYSLLGPNFKPESYLKKGPLLEAILMQSLKVPEVHSDVILKMTIEQYLHEIQLERSKPGRPKVVVSFASLVNALPYPNDENEAATIGMVRAYLCQPALHKTMDHLVDAVTYNTKGLMLKQVLEISLNLNSVRTDTRLFGAIKSVIDRIYMDGYGAQAVEWVLLEENKGDMSIDVFSIFSTLDIRSLKRYPSGLDALKKILYFVVHDFQSSYLDGFDLALYKTKATLLQGAFQFFLRHNAISPKLKECIRLLMPFIKFDGVGATPITEELD